MTHRRRPRRAACSAIAVVALALLVQPALAGSRSDWQRLVAGNFVIYSTLGDSATRDVARQLEAFEQTVGEMVTTGDRLPDTPTFLYLLGDHDFNKYAADRPGLGGFFAPAGFANLMVVNVTEPFKLIRVVLLHEYVHYLQHNTSAVRYPPWFMEGYAELFSGFSLDDKGNLELGNLPYGVRMYRGQWIPVERLLAVTQRDPEYRNERLAPEFYGEAWALVHYLLFDDTTLLGPTQRYLEYVDSGYPEPQAFADAFPFDKHELDRRLQAFVKRGVILLKKVRLRDEIVRESAPLTRLTPAEADLEFTRMAWLLRRPPAIVAPLMQETLARQPDSVPARALEARIAAGLHQATHVDDLVEHYATGGVSDPQVRIDLAAALLGDGGSPSPADKALRILDEMVHTGQPSIEAVALWTRATEERETSPAQVASILEPVLARAPHNTMVLSALARAAERGGDRQSARDYYNQIILVSSSPEERLWAQKQADSPRLRP